MTPNIFTSSFYLFHYRLLLFFNFENSKCDLLQLEHPEIVEAHNATWHPKVVEANNYIHYLKAAKSNNVIMSAFYTFPFFSIFLLFAKDND